MTLIKQQNNSLDQQLILGAEQLNLNLSQKQVDQLLSFVDLLLKWNKTYNLTAITQPEQVISKHILDSLSIVRYVDQTPLLDVGSGAGLPGIIIAIIKPEISITLLDSIGKKCRFMQMAFAHLALEKIKVVHTRLEQYNPQQCFGQISCRAFASVDKVKQLSDRLLCDNGQYLLMKSDKFLQENNLPTNWTQHELLVPGMVQTRYLLTLPKT